MKDERGLYNLEHIQITSKDQHHKTLPNLQISKLITRNQASKQSNLSFETHRYLHRPWISNRRT